MAMPTSASDKSFSIATWILSPENDDDFVIASQMNPEDKDRGWLIELGSTRADAEADGRRWESRFRPAANICGS